ncbi:MAG: pyruvate carboxylase subunit B, partial [Candidatus Dormibacteraeota bacterium]|nr:pyruvate carboxylase subunit B [Candidatus Dormibacteraeota bacterium]
MPGSIPVRLTDTTLGDAQQQVLGGHLPAAEILSLAHKLDGLGLAALEAFGAATFQRQLEKGEDPWEYLRGLRQAAPNTPIQALVRGQSLVGARSFADDAVELFIRTAADCGVDVFRVFDPLNDVRNLKVAISAARKAGRRVQGALCYTTSPVHDLDTWRRLGAELVELGVDDLVITDGAGLLTPAAAHDLLQSLATLGLPVLVHAHCSSGLAPMAYTAALAAGAAGLDTALSPLAWGDSQPATESVVAALAGSEHDTGVDLDRLLDIRFEVEELKRRHAEDLCRQGEPLDAGVLRHGLPPRMLEEVERQLGEHQACERLSEALTEAARVRMDLGHPPLVTPMDRLIASQAVFNLLGGERYQTVTQELKEYLQGLYGATPAPASVEVRRLVLGSDEPVSVRPADLLEPEVDAARDHLGRRGLPDGDGAVLSWLMFPALATDLFRREAEPLATEPGEEPVVETQESNGAAELEEVAGGGGEPPPAEAAPVAQTAEFEVEVEGEVFRVRVSGAGMTVAPAAAT